MAALFFDLLWESLPADIVLGALVLYNILALWWLHRGFPAPGFRALLLAGDTVLIGLLSAVTGGIESPFAGRFYLVALKAAADYGVAGGAAAAVGASILLVAVSVAGPEYAWYDVLVGRAGAQKIPYLILVGAVAGYLVTLLKQFQESRHRVEEDLLRLQLSQEAQQREMDLARRVQNTSLAPPPRHPLFEVAVRYEPAGDVGGDFYVFFPEPTRMAVLLGDVCGKGVSAALLATSICYLARSLRPFECPGAFLSEVNRRLEEQSPDSTFATAVLALLDGVSDQGMIYNAGHPPVLRVSEGTVEPLQFSLGIVADVDYAQLTCAFGPEDMLVLYSDAFIEVQNAEGEALGEDGFEELVRQHAALDPDRRVVLVVPAPTRRARARSAPRGGSSRRQGSRRTASPRPGR